MMGALITPTETALLRAYRLMTRVLSPLLPLWVKRRAANGKEETARLSERYGQPSRARPKGPLVWFHGASIGECTMLLPLIHKLKETRNDINVLLTSGTVTSAALMARRLPPDVIHQYVPLDSPAYVDRFVSHWAPDTAIWAESEIWPNLIRGAKLGGAKLAFINARMSERSIQGWQKRRHSAAALFSQFDAILAADERTANGLSDMTGKDILVTGNLKQAGLALPANEKKLTALKTALGGRPAWCAASTHHGEDESVLSAHKQVLKTHPHSLLILAPRHPERGDNICELINAAGLSFSTRSSGVLPDLKTQVYLFDTIGEMGTAFRTASVTLMCGSLLETLSGHNPLEPARLGCAVMSGPFVSSFSDEYTDMKQDNSVITAANPAEISKTVTTLLSDPIKLKAYQDAALTYSLSRADILETVWTHLLPLLPQKSSS